VVAQSARAYVGELEVAQVGEGLAAPLVECFGERLRGGVGVAGRP
jgi:hypothetical protein